MGTGKGSRSGPGSSSSSGSGSPPPPPPPPPHRAETQGGDGREADEEEPAEKNSSQPSGSGSASTTSTESSACSHTVASTPPRTGRRPQPELASSPWLGSSVTASPAWSGQSLQTGSPGHRRPSLSSEDGESSLDAGTSARKRSVKSCRPEGGGGLPESAHPGGHHPQQCESHGGHPSRSSSSLEQGASRETPSRGDPQDTGDPSPTHPSQLSGVPLGGPPESSSGIGDPAPQPSDSPGSRLLEHHNLVQEEKLVAATLASLDQCGNPSNIIKQDLRLIIQSRRKAEGKEELSVDFKSPPKEELSEEEWQRALKRRHQNRRAAQRFRHKQRQISSSLADKVKHLEDAHKELVSELQTLEAEKLGLLKLVYQHSRVCKDFDFKLKLQQALGYRLITSDPRKWPS